VKNSLFVTAPPWKQRSFAMSALQPRPASWSATTVSQVLSRDQANIFATIHGGELIKLMDTAAGICAIRHAEAPVATKAIGQAVFHRPVYAGQLSVCRSRLTFVKQKVMEIWVEFQTCSPGSNTSVLCLSGFFYYVAIDTATRATLLVPPLELTSETEAVAAAQGAKRLKRLLSKA
jgi:acyl-CoA hydrolase